MKFNSFLNLTKSRANGLNIVSRTSGERQTHTADLQVNEENLVVECFNRFPIPKV